MWAYNYMEDELYHYGRKGMKWGKHIFGKKDKPLQNDDGSLTKYGEKAVKKYQKKEVKKIQKQRKKEFKKEAKELNEMEAKMEKASSSFTRRMLTSKGATDKYAKKLTESIAKDKIAEAEIDRVMNMKLSDIQKEQTKLGEKYVRGYKSRSKKAKADKTNMRVTTKSQNSYEKQARIEANREAIRYKRKLR